MHRLMTQAGFEERVAFATIDEAGLGGIVGRATVDAYVEAGGGFPIFRDEEDLIEVGAAIIAANPVEYAGVSPDEPGGPVERHIGGHFWDRDGHKRPDSPSDPVTSVYTQSDVDAGMIWGPWPETHEYTDGPAPDPNTVVTEVTP